MYAKIITIAALILLAIVIWLIIHQKTLKQRAYLMKEAILNRDFTFRLSSKGLLPGERPGNRASTNSERLLWQKETETK